MNYVRFVPPQSMMRTIKGVGALWPDYCYPAPEPTPAVMIAEPIMKCLGRTGLIMGCIVHVCIATWKAHERFAGDEALVDGVKAAVLAGDWRTAWELCWPHMADDDGPI